MNNSVVIISCYFGRLPSCFSLWLKSCAFNPDVDFFIVTDQTVDAAPPNVRVINMSLHAVKAVADRKFGLNAALNHPYKLCDFKPVYGILFEDYVKDYKFWGHCDLDLIFGRIRDFFTDDILCKYDKLLFCGHLSVYRNTTEVNERYRLDGADVGYAEAFATKRIAVFDEWPGIYSIYKKHGFPMYEERVDADISMIYKRMRIARSNNNFRCQLFYWDDGEIKRAYYDGDTMHEDRFAYIHFKYRRMQTFDFDPKTSNRFAILSNGFVDLTGKELNRELINSLNPYPGQLVEKLEYLKFKYCYEYRRRIAGRLKRLLGIDA